VPADCIALRKLCNLTAICSAVSGGGGGVEIALAVSVGVETCMDENELADDGGGDSSLIRLYNGSGLGEASRLRRLRSEDGGGGLSVQAIRICAASCLTTYM